LEYSSPETAAELAVHQKHSLSIFSYAKVELLPLLLITPICSAWCPSTFLPFQSFLSSNNVTQSIAARQQPLRPATHFWRPFSGTPARRQGLPQRPAQRGPQGSGSRRGPREGHRPRCFLASHQGLGYFLSSTLRALHLAAGSFSLPPLNSSAP